MPEYTKDENGTATCETCGETVFMRRDAAQANDGEWVATHSCSADEKAGGENRSDEDDEWKSYYERLAQDCPYC